MSDLMSGIEELDEQMQEAGITEVEVQTHYPPDDFDWPDLADKQDKFEALPPAPVGALPVVLRDMCREASTAFKISIEAAMINALSIVSGCASRHYAARIKKGVEARPNLYALTFQVPGERKSSTFKPFTRAPEKWICEQRDDWEDKKIDKEIRVGKIEALKRKLKNDTSENPHADLEEIKKLQKEPEICNPNFIKDEGTSEALARRMKDCDEQLLLASSDASQTLAVMFGKYAKDGRPDIGFYLKSFDGDPYGSERSNEDNSIQMDNPCLSIALTTQVRELEAIKRNPELFGSGFMSRFLFCVPDGLAGAVDEGGEIIRKYDDAVISAATEEKYLKLIYMLLEDRKRIKTEYQLPICDEARSRWIEFYNDTERKMGAEYADAKDTVIRLPHLALKIVAGLAVYRADDAPSITLQDMNNAIRLVEYFWLHTERLLGMISKRKMPKLVRRIIDKLKKDGANVIQTSPMLKNLSVKAEDLQEAIKWMLDNKHCREIEVVNTHRPQGGRKPATNYEVNPTLL